MGSIQPGLAATKAQIRFSTLQLPSLAIAKYPLHLGGVVMSQSLIVWCFFQDKCRQNPIGPRCLVSLVTTYFADEQEVSTDQVIFGILNVSGYCVFHCHSPVSQQTPVLFKDFAKLKSLKRLCHPKTDVSQVFSDEFHP